MERVALNWIYGPLLRRKVLAKEFHSCNTLVMAITEQPTCHTCGHSWKAHAFGDSECHENCYCLAFVDADRLRAELLEKVRQGKTLAPKTWGQR